LLVGDIELTQGTGGQSDEAQFAGDIPVEEAWSILRDERDAALIDVRTDAEWSFVGVPDLSELGKQPLLLSWQRFPDMSPNIDFVETLRNAGIVRDAANLFICRSGARSRSAGLAMAADGFTRCYNVAAGFEGDKDIHQHRGSTSGWKAAGLPWVQS
tara:strand:+ start:3054 stop:3524 length:471 start_codon:yes stop_codon:yes gene_type:complete